MAQPAQVPQDSALRTRDSGLRTALRRFRLTEFQLLVVPSLLVVVGLLTIFLVPRRDTSFTWRDIWISLAFVALLYALTLWFSASGFQGDQLILPIVATMSGLVDRLVEHGMVKRRDDPADRRIRRLSVTPAGSATLRSLVSSSNSMPPQVLAQLADDDLRALVQGLLALDRVMDELAARLDEDPLTYR